MPRTPQSLSSLPRSDDEWFVGVHRLDVTIKGANGKPSTPYVVFVVSHDSGMILSSDLIDHAPVGSDIGSAVGKAMRAPAAPGMGPSCPSVLIGADDAVIRSLELFSRDEDLHCEIAEMPVPPEIIEMLEMLESSMHGPGTVPPITSVKGAAPELLAGFFDAAADYYRGAPWVHLSNHQVLAVRHSAEPDFRYVLTMGQGGVEYGLAVYRRWDDLMMQFNSDSPPVERMPEEGALSLTYDNKRDALPGDVEAIRRHRWKVAGANAYPVAIIINNKGEVTRPSAGDLRWFEAALRAMPAFARAHLKPDGHGDYLPVEATINVKTHSGNVDVVVKYPAGDLRLEERPAQLDEYPLDEDDDMPSFDRRAMEGSMAALVSGMDPARRGKNDKLDEAQGLMYRAFEERNPARRIALTHDALALSPDCADAYVLLAEEEAPTVEKALEYYRAGVAAGERALGPETFAEDVGHFWLVFETRPYMRARLGVATSLERLHRFDEAVAEMREMLRLNPNDNQGVRDILLNLLMIMQRDDDVDALLDAYAEQPTANWLYTRALQAFKRNGDGPAAVNALKAAIKANPHVVPYLTGAKRVPVAHPPYIGLGDESEAVYYVTDHLNYWRRAHGAVAWLMAQSKTIKRRPVKRRRK
ncbi:MAG: hypothetical protein HZB53_06995 [Chloroflexi bacterium]|nr:hypothetical protein [Chloroflexota bacterium]